MDGLVNIINKLEREINSISRLSEETNDKALSYTLSHKVKKLQELQDSLKQISNSLHGLA